MPLPRLAGVTSTRCLLFESNTPWNRVRFTRGFGTRMASLPMESNGSKMICVVPSLAFLLPASEAGLTEMPHPDEPRCSKQKYRLTVKGLQVIVSTVVDNLRPGLG